MQKRAPVIAIFILLFLVLSTDALAVEGTQKWAFPAKDWIHSSPAIGTDGTIYVGSADGYLYALNPVDGTKKWAFPAGGGVGSSPAIGTDGTIYVGSADVGNLYAVNPVGGTQKWAFPTGNSVFSSPAIGTDGTIYVGSDDGSLYAINPGNGTQKWAFPTGGGIGSSPAIGTDGTIYVGSDDGSLYAINPGNGTQKWAFPTGGGIGSSPAIGTDGTIYVGSDGGSLYAINPGNGTQKWAFPTAGSIGSSPAIGDDGTVYVGSDDGSLYAINPGNGTQKWAFPTGNSVFSSPAIGADGTIYVGSADGYLYALNPVNGTQKWAFPTGNSVFSSPAIGADGTIYVGSYDNSLYAVLSDSPVLTTSPWPMFHHDLRHTGRVPVNPANGQCGSANGGTFTTAPTTDLCSVGTASAVTGSGPWTWTCQGDSSTAQCQANQGNSTTWTVTSSVTGGNGTISCTSPVNHGLSSTCTITPNTGYRLATLTDNGSDVTGQVAGNVYTIPTVTTNHTVIASFVTRGATILWRNISTGQNSVWYMDGSTHTATATLESLAGAWRMAATADFNTDGEPDILWRNMSSGANMVWYMNGTTHTGSADLTPMTDQNWKVAGVADFNNDGKPDILWRNMSTGVNTVWYMNGVTHTGSADLTLVADENWKIVGVADFNEDGNPDVFWRNSATGQNVVWYMEGITRTGVALLDTVADQNWKVAGTTDLNNDGKQDILWRNTATGANMVWYMNGIASTAAILETVTDQNMEIAGQGNYSAPPPPPPPTNGQCGSANGGTFTTAPTTNLCTAGTASAVTGTGPWTWTCVGLSGGSDASCQANQPNSPTWTVTPSEGSNGAISPKAPQTVNDGATKSFTITPNAGYTAFIGGTCGGAPSSGAAPFTYTTNPIATDCTVVATFIQIGAGVCGSANGGIFTTAPTTNLCSVGTPSTVDGTGPWTWTCQGDSSTAQCQAYSKAWTVTSSVTGGNGTISCTSPVADELDSLCILHPNTGYRLATLTDNGSNVTGQVGGNVYTIPTVTTNHTVIARFATPAIILWRNISTGQNSFWYMNGSTHTATATLESLPGAWRMVGTADFNNDGEADILWRNMSSGANMVWYMNGAAHTGSADVTPMTDQSWKIVGVADFTSDGKPDILWRNMSTGENMVWYMNGPTRISSGNLARVTDQSWKIVGAADLTGDGNPDIFWRNSTTGQNVVWYMEGITRTGVALLDTVADQNWKMVAGATDLNNDGKRNILWRNTATGANMVWYMNGIAYTAAIIETVTDQNMEIAGQGNYSEPPPPPPPTNGQCGSANGRSITTAPATDLCSVGTASAVTGTGPWTWTCVGLSGGSTASCQANQATIQIWTVTPAAGSNGAINPNALQAVTDGATTSFTVTPAAGYSAAVGGSCGGGPSSGAAPFTYTTNPITANCTVVATFTSLPPSGVCGSANGGVFASAPTTDLCSVGTPSAVMGSGPWIWTCQTANGSVQCQAYSTAWTVTSSVTGGNGTISCTSPVNHGLSSTCTITPNTGYRLAALTDNGSDVTGQVAGNVYTIPAVTTNHTVIASFVTRGATILWRNISTGENSVWYMNGATHTATATLEPLAVAWRMVGTADFNNDAEADILWRNMSSGANMVWYMNGATHTGSADLTPMTDQNWKVAGVADFTSDGKPDILWRNMSTGVNTVWYMNGVTQTGSADLTLVADENWKIVGVADFNEDGNPDVFWRNSATGQNVVWYMEGITHPSFAFLDTVADQNWKVAGTTDLNNDGKQDILWRNTATGANMVWYMNGIAYTAAILETVTDQNMMIAGPGNNN